MRRSLLALAAIAAMFTAAPAGAATPIVSGNTLTGATGVNVGGTLYNVTFVDGTCTAQFGGCASSADFAFTNVGDATAAAQALLDQVFLDGLSGAFDTIPFLTNGCADVISCTAWVPYSVSGIDVLLMTAQNTNGFDQVPAGITTPSGDTSQATSVVWARFALPGAAVPEPSSWAMMLLGFGGIGVALRRRRKVAALA